MALRETGRVKWFDSKKGYGFIVRENGGDIFVHFRSIRLRGKRFLREGQLVEYAVGEGEGGIQAEDVRLLGGEDGDEAICADDRVPLGLLVLRLSIFIVMLFWVLDSFLRPAAVMSIYQHFYLIGGITITGIYIIGAIEALILLGFLFGMAKRLTYGLVFILHAAAAIAAFSQFVGGSTMNHLIYYTASPMLAATFVLYYLRDLDTLWTLGKK